MFNPAKKEPGKPQAANEAWKDPALGDRDVDEAKRKALRMINAIRVLGPLLSAATEASIAKKGDQKAAELFKKMAQEASGFSGKIISRLGLNPEEPRWFWLRNMLERSFAQIQKEMWTKGKTVSLDGLAGPMDALMEMPLRDLPPSFEPGLSEEAQARLALARACAPVLGRAMAGFDFFRDMEKDISQIGARLLAAASWGAETLASKKNASRDRANLFSVLAQEAGELYAAVWWACGKEALKNLERLSDPELEALMKDNPEGLSLDKVNEEFEKNFSRMVTLAKKLLPERMPEGAQKGA